MANGHWWVPSGRVFLSPHSNGAAAEELAYARAHFFLPHRYCDSFHTNTMSTESFVTYDDYNLLMVETHDPFGNTVTVNTRDNDGNIAIRNDYRALQPYWVTDPNGNRSQVAFDALGLVAGTAVMGKATETLGDLLDASFAARSNSDATGRFHGQTTRSVSECQRECGHADCARPAGQSNNSYHL